MHWSHEGVGGGRGDESALVVLGMGWGGGGGGGLSRRIVLEAGRRVGIGGTGAE